MDKGPAKALDQDIEEFTKRVIDSMAKVSLLKYFFQNRRKLLSVEGAVESLGDEEVASAEIEELVECQVLEKEESEEKPLVYRLTSDERVCAQIESFLECFDNPEDRLRIIALILETQALAK